jgi:ABC transporter substrate binding protein
MFAARPVSPGQQFRCPLWVRSVRWPMGQAYRRSAMSAMGQKQTSDLRSLMSAYPQTRTLPGDGWMSALCQKRSSGATMAPQRRHSLLLSVLLVGSLGSALAETARLPEVGYLGFGAAVSPTTFLNRLTELGYAEGKGVVVQYRFADGRASELPRLARELVDAKVDLIMAVGDEAIVAAKNATRAVPIVIVACDAVTTGFVASLARPGGNLTGVTCLTSELMQKRMAVFRELLPSLTRLAVLYNPENVSKPDEAARTVVLAREQGLYRPSRPCVHPALA